MLHHPLPALIAFLAGWVATIRDQRRRARAHPNGGCCRTCGAETPAGWTECDDCYHGRQY